MKNFVAVILAFALASCALPDTTVKTGSPRPALAVQGAPAGAVLVVDGMEMGEAGQYDGKSKVLLLEEGAHRVEIKSGGQLVHSEKVFISNGETSLVQVNTGAK